LWIPHLNLGTAYIRHDGGDQLTQNASLVNVSRNYFEAGAGLTIQFATTDAIFAPLAARQALRSRQADIQTAKNDALLATAEAYFTVQQARGRYAGMLDSVGKARELVRRVRALGKDLAPPVETDRALTLLADLQQAATAAHEDWLVASANLTRILRLDPAAVIVPLEPDFLQVSLISPAECLDHLIPIGLTNRPELASQQAIVQQTIARLRQERLRPLIPSLLLTGNGTPEFLYQGGVFGTGNGSKLNQFAGRSDVGLQIYWQLENLGLGNRARIRERAGENQLALIELFRVQDLVAAEVAQAHAQLASAVLRIAQAEIGLNEALVSYKGNLRGMGETIRFGDLLQLVNRPQEVVASVQQLRQAYDNYFGSIADYNRAQFRLFRALGYPAGILACQRSLGEILPIHADRPPPLPPVQGPEPCTYNP
jgi:outer membrane protein TolC